MCIRDSPTIFLQAICPVSIKTVGGANTLFNMLDQIIQFSIKNKLIVGLFTLALIGYGAYETTRLPIDCLLYTSVSAQDVKAD